MSQERQQCNSTDRGPAQCPRGEVAINRTPDARSSLHGGFVGGGANEPLPAGLAPVMQGGRNAPDVGHRFRPILGIRRIYYFLWKGTLIVKEILRVHGNPIRCRGVAPFVWLLAAVLFVVVTGPIMATASSSMLDSEPVAAELFRVLPLLFQIDKLWLCTRKQDENKRPVRYALVVSAVTTGLTFIKLTLVLQFVVSRLGDSIEALLVDSGKGDRNQEANDGSEMSLADEIRAAGGVWPWAKKFHILLDWMWPRDLPFLRLRTAVALLIMLGEVGLALYAPYVRGAYTQSLEQVLSEKGLTPCEVLSRSLGRLTFMVAISAARQAWLPRIRQMLWKSFSLAREQRIEGHIYAFFMDHDATFHNTVQMGDMTAAPQMALKVCALLDWILLDVVRNFVTLVTTVVAVSLLYGRHIVLVLACVVTFHSLIIHRSYQTLMPLYAERTDTQLKARQQRMAGLWGWRTVVLYGQVKHEINDYEASQEVLREMGWRIKILYEAFDSTSDVVLTIGKYIVTALVILHADSTFSTVMAFEGYWSVLLTPLLFFIRLPNRINKDFHGTSRLRRLLERKHTVVYGAEDPEVIKGDVHLRNVAFNYMDASGKTVPVFKNLNLVINAGKTTAIVGPSGVGKTTLLDLIRRFIDPNEGCVEIDGKDVRAFKKEMLARCIAVMPQDPHLFKKSISDNIRYGRRNATDSDVCQAAMKVGIHDDIMSRDGQYEAMISAYGRNLSGGQKQRIALARIVLRKPSLLLFDEATSALDVDSEALVKRCIQSEFCGKTVVYVTHRLPSIRDADKIVVLGRDEDGCSMVVETGTHEHLLAKGGAYAGLWEKHIGKTKS